MSPSSAASATGQSGFTRARSNSLRNSTSAAGTFAPTFIKAEEECRGDSDRIRGIEGENDFSGKRYVWVKDGTSAFVKGWVMSELEGSSLVVQCDDGTVSFSQG